MHAYTQNGEEDTVLRDDLKRVKKKLFLTFAIAIIGTCVVFGILYDLGIDWTAIDYLGESGIGRFYYAGESEGEHYQRNHYPWHSIVYCR